MLRVLHPAVMLTHGHLVAVLASPWHLRLKRLRWNLPCEVYFHLYNNKSKMLISAWITQHSPRLIYCNLSWLIQFVIEIMNGVTINLQNETKQRNVFLETWSLLLWIIHKLQSENTYGEVELSRGFKTRTKNIPLFSDQDCSRRWHQSYNFCS